VVADEAEILTLATDPSNRRQGVGRQLLEQVEQGATTANATTIFLEVSDRNIAAKALYKKAGYEETARRNDYYQEPDGGRADALILRKTL
jgi:ribosomal-protein-alanine N-acetyltransferase